MDIILFGLNHRSAPLGIREQLVFSPDRLETALRKVTSEDGIQEGLIVSTCNRTELIAVAGEKERGFRTLKNFLLSEKGFGEKESSRYCYQFAGPHAVHHLFRVAAGLDSQILGENQILGQIKEAFARAKETNCAGPVLHELLQKTLSVAKRVRTETGINRNPVSFGSAAARLARQIFGDLRRKSILVIGSGKMSELAVRHLAGNGVEAVFITNRTYGRAAEMAQKHSGVAIRFDQWFEYSEKVDMILTSTAAPHTILDKEKALRLMRLRRSRPLFIIDIAVPRDVDPAVNEIDNVYLYDIDALEAVGNGNRELRRKAAIEAEKLVEGAARSFSRTFANGDLTSTIVAMRNRLYSIRETEMRRFRKKFGPLSPRQSEGIEELTTAIVNKILHPPMVWLKQTSGENEASRNISLVQEIFGICESPGFDPNQNGKDPRKKAGDSPGAEKTK